MPRAVDSGLEKSATSSIRSIICSATTQRCSGASGPRAGRSPARVRSSLVHQGRRADSWTLSVVYCTRTALHREARGAGGVPRPPCPSRPCSVIPPSQGRTGSPQTQNPSRTMSLPREFEASSPRVQGKPTVLLVSGGGQWRRGRGGGGECHVAVEICSLLVLFLRQKTRWRAES